MSALEPEHAIEDGFWAVTSTDYYTSIEKGYVHEIEALRVINEQGYGAVRFIPWGMSISDLDIAERVARGEPPHG